MGGKKFGNIFILILVLSAVFLVYRFFLKPSNDEEVGLVGLAPAGIEDDVVAQATDEFMRLLLSLQAIDLKNMPAVLAVLSGLEDYSTELELKDPGRENPFAPIGVGNSRPFGGGAAITTTRTATTTATTTSQ